MSLNMLISTSDYLKVCIEKSLPGRVENCSVLRFDESGTHASGYLHYQLVLNDHPSKY